ncbi:MAG: DUF373 family protein [Candidatus Diapherotrites archaeon]|nr:DUF373 family protein [Candidatus Diapherotrites archaeon]
MALLVLVVDRDDDVGVKAGIETPVVGRDNVLKAAEALLLADPEDSDGNTMFAAVKMYDELVSSGRDAEVAVVSGDPRLGMLADMRIRSQLEKLFSEGNYEGIVFVSDGAEDDEVLPIVSSFAPVVSKKTVIVRQAHQLERLFYTIKTALEDPSFARLFLGLPGLILLLWVLLPGDAPRLLGAIVGAYLLLRGLGLEEPLINTLKAYLRIDFHSPAFPFHVLSLAILVGGTVLALHTLSNLSQNALYEAMRLEGWVLFTSILLFLLGKSLEAIVRKEGYKVGDYLIFAAVSVTLFLIGDLLLNFLEGKGSLLEAAVTTALALLVYFSLSQLALVIKRAPLLSKKLVGASVYDRTGIKIGKVKRVREGEIVVEKGRRTLRFPIERAKIVNGRVVIH